LFFSKRCGLRIWRRVPNLDLLSSTKYSPVVGDLLIFAWNLDTEISVTRMSVSWPLPTLINYLSFILITWTIRIFYNVTLSRTIKSCSGLSKSKISIGLPIFFICF